MNCSIQSSRQGSKDENFVLDICNRTSNIFGIAIENICNTEKIPTKNGLIISKKQMLKLNINKNECLKSFDGIIKKKDIIIGYIFSKIVYNYGGHQDNVFEEAFRMGEWICKFGIKDVIYVILIDTNLDKYINVLKDKYKHLINLWIVNHVEFQQKIMISFNK